MTGPAVAPDRPLIRLSLRGQLVLGAAALLVLHLLLWLPRTGPVYVADEVGYLTNARVLAGGDGADLLHTSFLRGGYSLVLAPVMALVDDPVVAYHLSLGVNAVLGACLFPLLYLLLTRSLGVGSRSAIWPAFAAACYPSVTTLSGLALSENLLFPLVVVWLLAFGEMLAARSARSRGAWAVAVGLSASALWAVHGRMLVAVALSAAFLVVLVVRRRLTVWPAACGLVALGCALVVVGLLNDFLITENYGGRDFNEAGERLSGLEDLDGVLSVARNLVGQTWYLLVATFGVVLVLFAIDGRRRISAIRGRRAGTAELVVGLIILTTAGLLILSALSFSELKRPDMLIYGRYVDVLVPPLLAVSLALLNVAPSRRVTAIGLVVIAALTLVVAALRAGVDPPEDASPLNVASFPFLWLQFGPWALVGAGFVASAGVCVLTGVARRSPAAVAPVLVLLFLATTAHSAGYLVDVSRTAYPPGWSGPTKAVSHARAEIVGYDISRRDRFGGDIYAWFLPESVVVRFSAGQPPPSRYVFGSASWRRARSDEPARAVWRDPGRDEVLWALAGPASRQLAALRRIEACLADAIVAERHIRGPARTPQDILSLASGSRVTVLAFATQRSAAAHAAALDRLLRTAGRREAVVLARSGGVVATYPARVRGEERGALRRCL